MSAGVAARAKFNADSKYGSGSGEPTTFPLAAVIPGWAEGIQLMKVGDKFKFEIPPNLAFGSHAQDIIPPNSTLVFEVELLGIK